MQDEQRRLELTRSARAFVERHFSGDAYAARLERVHDEANARRGGAVVAPAGP